MVSKGNQRTSDQATAGPIPAPDPELLERLASGEIGALGELFDRYQEPVRRFVAQATCDGEDVDDLVHETFLAAAKNAGRYDGRPSCRPWLIGIAAQLLRRRLRALGRLVAVFASLRGSRTPELDPRSTLHARNDIAVALRRLGEAKRIAFLMAEVEELSCAEIAAALRVPIGTVWRRLHRARRELREMLEEGGS